MSREIGIECLSERLKNKKNVEIIEKYIFDKTHTEDDYLNVLYHTIAFLDRSSKKDSIRIKELLHHIFQGEIEWQSQGYQEYKRRIEEEDQFMTSPFEIEEGVLECKCGSKRTISFQRQTRSADEGSTTFAQCIECGNKWRHNN